jgi:hypothetical protein
MNVDLKKRLNDAGQRFVYSSIALDGSVKQVAQLNFDIHTRLTDNFDIITELPAIESVKNTTNGEDLL